MTRKTRKQKPKGIFSIPELRRSFEHIEEYVDNKIQSKESKEQIVKDLKREWKKTFLKDLDNKSAYAFVNDQMGSKHSRKTRKHGGAGAQLANTTTPLAGAPLDYTTRAGIYLAPGQIPVDGHLPLSDGSKSTFGSFVDYVSSGFWNPEPGQSYDPVQGQIRFPTSTPAGMGDNTVHFSKGGSRKNRKSGRKTRKGGSRFPASVPASIGQDMQDMWNGRLVGPSPNQVQR